MISGLKIARDATYTPRTIMDLELCKYKEKTSIFQE
jgi:hypothetical protein